MKRKLKLKLKKNILNKIVIFIIFICVLIAMFLITFYVYCNSREIDSYNKNKIDYSYIEIYKMSDSFAVIDNKELHFVIDKHNNIYIIAIYKSDIDKYKAIIDYSYGRIKKSKSIKVYGLPIKQNNEIKDLVIKYVNNFLSYGEKIPITLENYNEYIPDTFLDTTVSYYYKFNYVVFLLFLIFGIIFLIFIKVMFFKKIDEKN